MARSSGVQPNKDRRQHASWSESVCFMLLYDLMIVNAAYFLALWLRFDCAFSAIPVKYLAAWMKYAPIHTVITLFLFWWARLYHSVWKFAGHVEAQSALAATIVSAGLHACGITLLFQRMPVSYYLIGAVLQFILVLAVRFAYRYILLLRGIRARGADHLDRIMLIGAGNAGRMILRDLHAAPQKNGRVCCIIDDDPGKKGRSIDGVPIVGDREDIILNVEKYRINKIILAIPSASAAVRRDILQICKETECELKNLPGLYQLIDGTVTTGSLKDVDVEDLLGREPVKVNMEEIYQYLIGKVILVTGGGGSIGSELCRQIAAHHPKQLVIFDVYENNAHAIQLELKDRHPELNLVVLIGSVRDSRRLNAVFRQYQPDVVYHAAAHKHVPLMEYSPCEAIKNNTIGTYKTAYAAMQNGCKRFVLISTDKAVNPVNIMGASKRLCEMVIQTFDKKIKEGRACELPVLHLHEEDSEGFAADMPAAVSRNIATEFVAVRFGNVLGSNGSVIPRFKEQIAKGGPVTVTHPDIIRYFMTIPEAASLVLQAGIYAKGGEIFVLDMGSPVKIDTLARNLIKLSGLRPDEDIKIVYTGLRPGEKLYEERLMSEEGMRETENHLIHIGSPIPFEEDAFLVQLRQLLDAVYAEREDEIRRMIKEIVTTFNPVFEGAGK